MCTITCANPAHVHRSTDEWVVAEDDRKTIVPGSETPATEPLELWQEIVAEPLGAPSKRVLVTA